MRTNEQYALLVGLLQVLRQRDDAFDLNTLIPDPTNNAWDKQAFIQEIQQSL